VALISAGILRERLRGEAVAGLVLIGLALALIIGQWLVAADAAALAGVPWLLAASLGLATYTVAFRLSRLSPIEAVGYVGLWSMPIVAVLAMLRPHAFSGVDAGAWGFHLLTQGLLSGFVGVLAYGVALRHLGAVRGSMANAMMPVAAGLAGVLVLGERLGPLDWLAIALAALGVAAANGAFRRLRGAGSRPPAA
jgi:drug/metabolite transporter (DMT)-like permease